jgi:hypothetical protein
MYVIPNLPVIGMHNMRSIFMYLNARNVFTVDISSGVIPLFNNQALLAGCFHLPGEHSAKQSGTNDQVIVFLFHAMDI